MIIYSRGTHQLLLQKVIILYIQTSGSLECVLQVYKVLGDPKGLIVSCI